MSTKSGTSSRPGDCSGVRVLAQSSLTRMLPRCPERRTPGDDERDRAGARRGIGDLVGRCAMRIIVRCTLAAPPAAQTVAIAVHDAGRCRAPVALVLPALRLV